MRATNLQYSIQDSHDRIREILDAADNSYEDRESIPSEDSLTFTNGFYVDVTALFIDIRGSSRLAQVHKRPVLGKIYRAYISECVAVINSNPNCSQVFIEGDAVIGVFSTPLMADVDSVLETAAQLGSLNILLNHHLSKKQYSMLNCGIGIADGTALMIKAGHKGSSVNEIVWLGDVLSEAAHLCSQGNRGGRQQFQISTRVHDCLKPAYQAMLKPVQLGTLLGGVACYEASIGNIAMHGWLINCLKLPLQPLIPPQE